MARRMVRTTTQTFTVDSSGLEESQTLTIPGKGRILSVTVRVMSGTLLYQGIPGDAWVNLPLGGVTLDVDFDRHSSRHMPRFKSSGGVSVVQCHWKMEVFA